MASLWYLLMTSILTFGQYYLERYFARGALRQLPRNTSAEIAAHALPFPCRAPSAGGGRDHHGQTARMMGFG